MILVVALLSLYHALRPSFRYEARVFMYTHHGFPSVILNYGMGTYSFTLATAYFCGLARLKNKYRNA